MLKESCFKSNNTIMDIIRQMPQSEKRKVAIATVLSFTPKERWQKKATLYMEGCPKTLQFKFWIEWESCLDRKITSSSSIYWFDSNMPLSQIFSYLELEFIAHFEVFVDDYIADKGLYEAYKLNWMFHNNYHLADIVSALTKKQLKELEAKNTPMVDTLFKEWELEADNIWLPYEEWKLNEFGSKLTKIVKGELPFEALKEN